MSKGSEILALREVNDGYTHAENLHVFIQQALQESGLTAADLQAVAVSRGPGSYTGLRIGVSAAKGLAYALDIPLISVDTLQSMAYQASREKPGSVYVPMIDARRMEVYCAAYDAGLGSLLPVQAVVLDAETIHKFHFDASVYFFGDGMPKAKTLLQNIPGSAFLDEIRPSASHMVQPALDKYRSGYFEDAAYFEPYYLKDFVPGAR